jgi:hypothetical protein
MVGEDGWRIVGQLEQYRSDIMDMGAIPEYV